MAEWMIRTGDMLNMLSTEWLAVVALLAAAAGIGALLWLRALINRAIEWLGCEEVYDAIWMDAEAWEATR